MIIWMRIHEWDLIVSALIVCGCVRHLTQTHVHLHMQPKVYQSEDQIRMKC